MTLVLGLRCRDGVVLAADSQRTEEGFREEVPKLFVTPAGIVWGVAGNIAIQQELRATLDGLDLTPHPGRKEARDAIASAVRTAVRQVTATVDQPSLAARTVHGIFAWHSRGERESFLLRVLENGYLTLRLTAAKMLAFKVADDVIRASARSVGHPVQLAIVTEAQHHVLSAKESQAAGDTLAAFREHQREFLAREETPPPERDTGIRPS
jgi:20S proteasome alpha/beta subunit